jgi:PAS domain-containing protein
MGERIAFPTTRRSLEPSLDSVSQSLADSSTSAIEFASCAARWTRLGPRTLQLLRSSLTRTNVSILIRGYENQLEVIAAVALAATLSGVAANDGGGGDPVALPTRERRTRGPTSPLKQVPAWFLLDDRMTMVTASPQLQTLLRCDAHDLLGDAWEQFFAPPDLRIIGEQWMYAAQTKRPIEVVATCHTRTGDVLHVIHNAHARIDPVRNVFDGYLGSFTPV